MSSSALVPSTLSTSNLASTLRDAAELVVDVTAASAKSIADALPDNVPELAASLPAALPFVGAQQSSRRMPRLGRVAMIGAVVASVVAAAMFLRHRGRATSNGVREDLTVDDIERGAVERGDAALVGSTASVG